ncbi:polysaccharide deacetylase family protein [Natronobiforma cellulositropha]|uniref:polysaccharide deacetylase family protein n=1 Tax=Natronobiforma cellulositropha TaxID=1679076 RepID=UPI0021D5A268|nr:polysaccharide deacetylase family protein [Natronobiforma cellulositropha]
MKRRTYLTAATATTATLAIAGCLGGDDEPDEPDDSTNETDDHDDDPITDDEPEAEEEEEPDIEVDSFDDFEDLEHWEAAVGSVSADTDHYYTGSQSARLDPSGADQARIVRELEDPIDCSDTVPGMAVAAEGTVAPIIQLIDDDGDRIDFRQQVQGGLSLMRYNFGISGVHGDPDLSEIVEVQIIYWTGDEPGGNLWVDDLYFVERPSEGKVMVQFDGAYETVHSHAYPVLSEYDIDATVFAPTGRIREDPEHEGDRLTEDQLEELYDSGWTVGSYAAHGLDMTALESREQDEEIEDAVEWLEDHGYGDGARYFSYPSGRYDETTLELVEDHHELGFAGRYPVTGYVVNPLLCSRMDDPSPDDARTVLEWTAEYGGITTLVYYGLRDESRSNFEAAMSHLDELVSDGDLEVITPAELEESYVL